MTVGELEILFRTMIDDKEEPFLVSHESFLEYIDEAQEEACIRSRLIFDNFSSFTEIKIKEGVKKYNLNEKIYVITNAFIDDGNETIQLKITDRLEMDRVLPNWRKESGKPLFLIQYDNHFELNPVPDGVNKLNIECYLYPEKITNAHSSLQISSVNHRKLLHWVKYKYYDSQDNDIVDIGKSEKELNMFEKIFGSRPSANNMRSRYLNRPQFNKVYMP